MNVNEHVKNCCFEAIKNGIKVTRGGAWFSINEDKVTECCAIGAVLLAEETFKRSETLSVTPGYVEKACQLLGVSPSWLFRFWMGFDRGHQVIIISKDGKDETKDDVSAFGIQLANEMENLQKAVKKKK